MRWRVLGVVLAAILLGALAFSMWPAPAVVAPVIAEPERAVVQATPVAVPRKDAAAPAPVAAPVAVAAPPRPSETLTLDPEPDFMHLKALGLGPEDLEPLDGGVLHAITREGIKGAVKEEMPRIRECYEGWRQQNPSLGGRMKVEFTIMEIPGRDRAKVMRVVVADGGMGHVAMEGCVRNVFKEMRFEAPRGGEMRVSYPLNFEPGKAR